MASPTPKPSSPGTGTANDSTQKNPSVDAQLAEYQEVCSQFRALTEIRFKLLGFLPVGTIATVLVAKDSTLVSEPIVAVFGLLVTLCLATYNKRNDQLYNELVSRAAQLEGDLGLAHGSFSRRPRSWLSFGPWRIEHGWPVGFVYALSAAIWTYVAVNAVTPALVFSWKGVTFGPFWPWCATALALVGWMGLRKLERTKQKRLKKSVEGLEAAFRQSSHANLIGALKDNREMVRLFSDRKDAAEKIEGRLKAIALEQARSKHEPEKGEALALVLANVIDLPARWIHDLWTKRR
jgi:hypothetical protein